MTYASVCSGIEAATVAWHPLGWQPAWFSEIEPFPCRLLQHYYPTVPNLGDMLKLADQPLYHDTAFDLLVGGTPCQSFSLAGLRAGLDSANGNLALQFCRVLRQKRPRWFVWENVPGVLSSFSGEPGGDGFPGEGPEHGVAFVETADFATLLRGFSECGYSCVWRVLDSQFFGVPQRRRRVFVVGYLGDDWRPPAAVLLEPHCLRGDPPPSKKSGQDIAGTLRASASRSGGAGTDPGTLIAAALLGHHQRNNLDDNFVIDWPVETTGTLDASFGDKQGLDNQHIDGGAGLFVPFAQLAEEGEVVYHLQQISNKDNRSNPKAGDPAPTLTQQGNLLLVPGVRRLTPREFERLQGFPDDYTNIAKASDGARYKAVGNSMPVPVMRWIGRRVGLVDRLVHPQLYTP